MEYLADAAVESLTACPVDSITLNVASLMLPTTFSSRSPTPFKGSWIAPPIALIMELPPCATDSKVAPRVLPIPAGIGVTVPLAEIKKYVPLMSLGKLPMVCYYI